MFHHRSEQCQRALALAQREAIAWNHGYLGCEHLLIGLLKTSGSVAASALNELEIDETKTRAVLAEFVCPGKETAAKRRLPRTRRAKMAIKSYAFEEARKLGQRTIGAEHILLALLCDGENMAAKILACLGLKSDQVRTAVLAHVSP